MAWNSALICDMIYGQPVIYEFPLLRMPTLLLIGYADTTVNAHTVGANGWCSVAMFET